MWENFVLSLIIAFGWNASCCYPDSTQQSSALSSGQYLLDTWCWCIWFARKKHDWKVRGEWKNHRLKFDICILTPRNLETLSSQEGKWVERKNNRKQKVLIQLCPMLQTEIRLQWGLVISFSRQIQTPVINNHCYGQLKRVHQNFFLRSVSNVMLLPV